MDLIKQLGGYQEVKQMWVDGGSLQGTQLAFELLEYRRAHNIFEVGDVACYKNHINSSNTLFKFFYDNEYSDIISLLRHATDEEIKAGKRL